VINGAVARIENAAIFVISGPHASCALDDRETQHRGVFLVAFALLATIAVTRLARLLEQSSEPALKYAVLFAAAGFWQETDDEGSVGFYFTVLY
jgi:hypothetical protein